MQLLKNVMGFNVLADNLSEGEKRVKLKKTGMNKKRPDPRSF